MELEERSKISVADLQGVTETLLLPLAFRADECRHPNALLRDPKAAELVRLIECDWTHWLRQSHDPVTVLLRMREFDRRTQQFLSRNPDGIVVEIGCGLDTRSYRVDNGTAEWYELDLLPVIQLRRQLLDETPRIHFLSSSALDLTWLDAIPRGRSHLFLAEGVFMFFSGEEVKRLVCALRTRFPGAQLMFDSFTPFMVRISPLLHPTLRKSEVRLCWGLDDPHEIEHWGTCIRLLSQWFYFDQPEPRLGAQRIFRFIPGINKGARVVRYELGH